MRYFVDKAGKYLGAWDDVLDPPLGGFEVPSVPEHGHQIWDWHNTKWGPVPEQFEPITPRQLWLTLFEELGIEEAQVDALIAGNKVAQIEKRHATSFRRDHPLIIQMVAALGLTEEQANALWHKAEKK
jgi:hypothetical protein